MVHPTSFGSPLSSSPATKTIDLAAAGSPPTPAAACAGAGSAPSSPAFTDHRTTSSFGMRSSSHMTTITKLADMAAGVTTSAAASPPTPAAACAGAGSDPSSPFSPMTAARSTTSCFDPIAVSPPGIPIDVSGTASALYPDDDELEFLPHPRTPTASIMRSSAASAFAAPPPTPPRLTESELGDLKTSSGRRVDTAVRHLKGLIDSDERLAPYKLIPEASLYKLFIDAKRWPKHTAHTAAAGAGVRTGSGFAAAERKDLVFDVREPGYMGAMMEAFVWLFTKTPDVMTDELMEKLHDLSTREVVFITSESKARAFEPSYRSKAKSLERACIESFKLERGTTLSAAGYAELLKKMSSDKYNVGIATEDDEDFNLFDTALEKPSTYICLEEPKQPKLDIKSGKLSISYTISLKHLHERNIEAITTELQAMAAAAGIVLSPDAVLMIQKKIKSAISEYHTALSAFKEPRIVLRQPRTQDILRKSVKRLLAIYYTADRSTEDKALRAIAALVQDLDQLHPFYDGNIRTFAILLIQKLLLENGLSPTCIEDPNCVDCLSIDEIVIEIRKGQANFLSLRG